MTTDVSSGVTGADGTLADDRKLEEYFGCGADRRAFCGGRYGMAGIDGAQAEDRKLEEYFGCGEVGAILR